MGASRAFAFDILALVSLSVLTGCTGAASQPRSAAGIIPAEAKAVGPRKAGLLRYQAAQVGTIIVFDAEAGRVVFSMSLSAGTDFIFHPEKQVVALDGRVIPQRFEVEPAHAHQLYFRALQAPAEGTVGRPGL